MTRCYTRIVRALPTRGYTPLAVVAALSLAVLAVAAAWELGVRARGASAPPLMPQAIERPAFQNDSWLEELYASGIVATTTEQGSSTPVSSGSFTDDVLGELIDSYVALGKEGGFGEDIPGALAYQTVENARVPILFTEVDGTTFKTDTDTSYERMLAYRDDLRLAMEPLLIHSEAEFAIFARYVETGDRLYLDELRNAAERYKEAGERVALVVTPTDAVIQHTSVVNALNEFAAVLDAMARFADDPIASIAVLRAYNTAERHIFGAFNALAAYYQTKTP